MSALRSIEDVVGGQMCTGCGACAYVAPRSIRMVDDLDHGRRPVVERGAGSREERAEALRVCPGKGLAHEGGAAPEGALPSLLPAWGAVLQVWEGYAADPELRFAASSGGAASALALHALEREGHHGVLHITPRRDAPYLSRTALSRSRAELLAATGSRYAPASPCDGLAQVEQAPAPCVLVAKPCDVAAADAARRLRPELDRRLGLTVALFCAGTPTTRGTFALMRELGIARPDAAAEVRYRGRGWPGRFRVRRAEGEGEAEASLGYEASWGLLQRYRQWRCYVCADHTGEFADVAVGDPWYREIPEGEPGRSLVLARTERGRRAVERAIEAGALVAEPVDPELVAASQPELLRVRGAVWGRLLALRLVGAPAPRYRGFPMARIWWSRLPLRQKLQSVLGTLRRVGRRRLLRRIRVRRYVPGPPEDDTALGARKRVLAIASGGGHWVQLLRLARAFERHEMVYATVAESYAEEVAEAPFYVLPDANRKTPWSAVRLAGRALAVVLRERPDVVLSTGAAPGLFGVLFGRLAGARTVWVDSLANVDRVSLSGRLARPASQVWLTQWRHLSGARGPECWGSLL